MKKALYATEFLITFAFFVLPSILVTKRSFAPVEIKFTVHSLVSLLYFSVLLYANRNLFADNYSTRGKINPFFMHAYIITAFGILVASSVFFQAISFIIEKNGNTFGQSELISPHGILSWLSFAVAVVSGAFCEETCYRFAMVDFGKEVFNGGKIGIFWEAFACVVFALGHSYQGILGILNAFCSGIALRLLVIKTRSIFTSIAVHAAYNFLAALLYIFIFGQANS